MTSSYKLFPTDTHRPSDFKYDKVVTVDGAGDITLKAGSFIQDFEFKNGYGTLDRYNGRFTITPDFPQGTYAYFLTFKADTVDTTTIFNVTVASGTNGHGAGNKYYIEGKEGPSPVLTLTEGNTYRFDQSHSSNATHGLRFSIKPNGIWNNGIEYTRQVIVNGTAGQPGAYTEITVLKDTPTLYYYCVNHSGMGWTANTVGVGLGVPAYPYIICLLYTSDAADE